MGTSLVRSETVIVQGVPRVPGVPELAWSVAAALTGFFVTSFALKG